jgi:hypothetical protein
MKIWLAIILSGALIMAHTVNSSNGLGSKIAEQRTKLINLNTERLYAATNGATGKVLMVSSSVAERISELKAMTPIECVEGYLYLERMQEINASMPLDHNKIIVITQKINRLCEVSITLDKAGNIVHQS